MTDRNAGGPGVHRLVDRRSWEERLQVAVRLMQRSNEQLSTNVAEFRSNLNGLDHAMQRLERSTLDYQVNLGRIDVRSLRARAIKLGQIADRWLRPT